MKYVLHSLALLCLILTGCQTKPVASIPQIPLRPIELRSVAFPGKFIPADKADRPPIPLEGPGPVYPFELRRGNVEGRVMLAVAIDAKGNVKHVEVGSAADERFAKTAREALFQWKYFPAVKDGKSVPSYILQPVAFRLRDRSYTGNLE